MMPLSKPIISRRASLAVMLAALVSMPAGCGITYTSPSVEQAAGNDVAVRVIALTAQTTLLANRQPYTPRSLPAAFYQVAGGGSLRGAGALPELPYIPETNRAPLETRVPPTITPEPYRIGVGDVVLLATKSAGSTVSELSGLLAAQNSRQGYTVRDDGAITIPDIGELRIAGMTLREAEDALFSLLVEKQIDPSFSLEVSEFNSQRVSVGGAVASARIVPVTLGPLRLGEALTAAGGTTVKDDEFASIRIYRDGTLYQIPVEQYRAQPRLQKLPLVDGDSVYVDTNYDLDRALSYYEKQLGAAALRRSARFEALRELQTEISIRRAALADRQGNFSARTELDAEKRDYVYLAGEVKSQSRYTMPYGRQVTLADVLYDAGGFATATGDASNIYVLRPSNNPAEFGAVTAWHLDAKNIVNMTLATKLQMRPNDIVFIEEQPITKWGRALQQALPALINAGASAVK